MHHDLGTPVPQPTADVLISAAGKPVIPAPWAESGQRSYVPGVDDDTLTPENPRYQNVQRWEQSLQQVTEVVAAFAEAVINDTHKAMLATNATGNSAGDNVTLGQLPACTAHDRKPGGPRLKISELLKCATCGPWMRALATAAGVNASNKQLNKVINVR